LIKDQKARESRAKEIYNEAEEDINHAISRVDGSNEKRRGYYVCPFCNTFLNKEKQCIHLGIGATEEFGDLEIRRRISKGTSVFPREM
jgi:hypothetical protein